MASLKPGDRIECRVKDSSITSPYKEYDEIITFEIVAVEKYGYYVYVPPYLAIHKTFKADKYQCQHLEIDKRFLDADILYLNSSMVYKVKAVMDGLTCANCEEFFAMAEPNQENGTLICWSCRNNPYR